MGQAQGSHVSYHNTYNIHFSKNFRTILSPNSKAPLECLMLMGQRKCPAKKQLSTGKENSASFQPTNSSHRLTLIRAVQLTLMNSRTFSKQSSTRDTQRRKSARLWIRSQLVKHGSAFRASSKVTTTNEWLHLHDY